MADLVSASLGAQRFNMTLLGVFAGVALLLAAVGIYGVMAHRVGERTREIGVYIALGAQRSDVLRLVLGDGARLAVAGIGLGLLGALALTRVLRSLLFEVAPTDPGTFASVVGLLVGVAAIACYLPARRAVKVDPVTALRD